MSRGEELSDSHKSSEAKQSRGEEKCVCERVYKRPKM